jgi:peptide/nickel transport system permease protein
MTVYFIRRLLIGAFTLLVITMMMYALIRHIPGTPLTMAQENLDPRLKVSDEDMKLLNQAYGLDKPWYVAYFDWLKNLARFDLGNSFRYRKSVTGLILDHLGPTLLLSISSFLITYGAAIPLGLYSTRRSGKADERIVSVVFYMLYSLPLYVAALWLLYWFYLRFKDTMFHLPPGMTSDNFEMLSLPAQLADVAKHLLLPLLCYSYGALAYDTRFIKANMEEAIRQDYVRTARAKGLDERTILWRHAFRNTLIPFVTLLGLTLPGLISGAIILEQIFSWPGIGHLFYDAITFRDYPLIMGLTFMFAVATLAGQLFADVLYAVVDPRITYK